MASANIELARSIFGAWERGDWSSAIWADPEIVYVVADGPNPGTWKGLSEMSRGARANLDTWDDFRVKATEYRELDPERVLALTRFSGRGKTSGVEIAQMVTQSALLFEIRGGKVTRLVHYWEWERMRADLKIARDAGYAGRRRRAGKGSRTTVPKCAAFSSSGVG